MKNLLFAIIAIISTTVFVPSKVEAKCYRFSDAPSDVFVCVGKNGSDSFDDRKAAKKICDEKAGKNCGNVGSHSSSCHSNSNLCYDETGKAHRSLKDY
ncbi:hypothetical protein FRD01_12415 [Microvenator marinus]|jgi:hypothetical protein|uniref:Uncharacterized protein n=1 Tax=Microvenator marinus TaxID=2600177 RepID=A0A5B8XR77_9DELT|nr:hypothetical protein [Microvenator marinus]QED28024.1 hypothetical protein FRD01_12415 [Microvenator marinus]